MSLLHCLMLITETPVKYRDIVKSVKKHGISTIVVGALEDLYSVIATAPVLWYGVVIDGTTEDKAKLIKLQEIIRTVARMNLPLYIDSPRSKISIDTMGAILESPYPVIIGQYETLALANSIGPYFQQANALVHLKPIKQPPVH
jgi:hypothetical protein